MSNLPRDRIYLDNSAVIKAIEKCSLQSMFGPEVTSTRALLSKKSEASSSTTSISARYSNNINSVETRDLFDKDPNFPYSSTNLLPIEEADKGGDIPSKRTSDDSGIVVSLIKQEGNISSDHTTNDGGYPVLPGHEEGTTSLSRSNDLERVHQEKASYHKCIPFFSSFFNIYPIIRSKRSVY